MTRRALLPGLRGVDHIGLTVPDMRAALDFFVGVLGCEPYYSLGPLRDDQTDSFEVSFGIDPRAVLNEIKLLRLGNLNLELFEWDDSHQGQSMPSLNHAGGHEICLYVEDIDVAIAYLREHGVEVLGEKLALEGPEAGADAWYVYFRSPWGLVMELISYPHGRAYEADYERPLWNPTKPDPVI